MIDPPLTPLGLQRYTTTPTGDIEAVDEGPLLRLFDVLDWFRSSDPRKMQERMDRWASLYIQHAPHNPYRDGVQLARGAWVFAQLMESEREKAFGPKEVTVPKETE